jgi:hypothetical protein
MWASLHPRPTCLAAAPFPPNRFGNAGGTALRRLRDNDELTPDELGEQSSEELPERQALSLIAANVAAPVNAAAALNVLSDDSTAVADAEQSIEIEQSQ